jgi:hypothetical protein
VLGAKAEMHMPHGIKGWSVFVLAQFLLTGVWRLIIKLAENAVLGWGDDQIAAWRKRMGLEMKKIKQLLDRLCRLMIQYGHLTRRLIPNPIHDNQSSKTRT